MSVPPLRQSHAQMMGCPEFYRISVIEGKRMPDSVFSDRGTEVHRIMAEYIDHCARLEVEADWGKFDELASAAGPEAGPMLDGLRDNYKVDWQHVLGTEAKLQTTDEFQPINSPFTWLGLFQDVATYEGTLDVIEVSDDLRTAIIRDFKSHFRPFDPDTYQAQSYPALLFAHFQMLEEITFELIFVRFKNARRSVTYTREQLPVLHKEMSRRREQQVQIHAQVERGEQVKALPGDHCVYCPHNATNSCPVAELNPYVNKSIEDRLVYLAWLEKTYDENVAKLKAYVDAAGPVSYTDANGTLYEFGNHASERVTYPAVEAMRVLMDWHENGADPALFTGLSISGLSSKLKAKKRAVLEQRLRDEVGRAETHVRFGIHKAGDFVVEREEW